MQDSAWLRERYGDRVYGRGAAIPSLNFDPPIAWWQARAGEVTDPYALLPPLFGDVAPEEVASLAFAEGDRIAEGGAAMAAYARLQSEDLTPAVQGGIRSALLRYCELDTLAMVMTVEAWRAA